MRFILRRGPPVVSFLQTIKPASHGLQMQGFTRVKYPNTNANENEKRESVNAKN